MGGKVVSRQPLAPAGGGPEGLPAWLGWLGFAAVAAVSVAPFFFDPHPTRLAPRQGPGLALFTSGSVVLGMLGTIALRAWGDRRRERHPLLLSALFLVLALALTAYHWHTIDQGWFEVREGLRKVRFFHVNWQRALYAAVLNHWPEKHGENWVPHIYRPLPYGFTRSLELWTGSWSFACFAYRAFFTWWFVWASYRFLRLVLTPARALAGLALYAILYPFSIHYYMGQLTDPMSHAFFALAMVYVFEDRWPALTAALALGVLAKETAVVFVPAYLACWWRRGHRVLLKTALLGVVAVAAFLAARLPIGWRPDSDGGTRSINGSQWMVARNLGLGDGPLESAAPAYQNYLQPLLFIGVFLPLIAKHWPRLDYRLRALFLTLVPPVFLSNLCFSWLHESRNYVPLLPLLVAMAWGPPAASGSRAGPAARPRDQREGVTQACPSRARSAAE
jgi:hypothetical protein